ncbi:MAG: DUF512 domain-containing protein [Clostridiales bacterium]|nr:DUF512 domain-containing protein [Clostridiales bacterium]
MSVIVTEVKENSLCWKRGITEGYTLLSINGHAVNDVLDYRFYGNARRLHIVFLSPCGEEVSIHLKTGGCVDDLGLEFHTYLMDKQHSCKNKCIFCFVDQMPSGMRESLYFKDDDSRLSFLFGNYVTLTNMTEADIDRLIEMHISPINISVHTMNPDLRVKMMKNPNAGKSLAYIKKLADAGTEINAQLVLCPGYNDGEELLYSLRELYKLGESVISVAAVPVGLTKHREGLCKLECYTKEGANEVIDMIDSFNMEHYDELGRNFAYAADEFYLKAMREMPNPEYYDEFNQLDNGVGLWALTKYDFYNALKEAEQCRTAELAVITGVAASPLINELAAAAMKKFKTVKIDVKTIVNDFFGHEVTVAGLVTAGDIIKQSGDLTRYDEVLVPQVMLRDGDDHVFLDDITVEELSKTLNANIKITPAGGRDFLNAIIGLDGKGSK